MRVCEGTCYESLAALSFYFHFDIKEHLLVTFLQFYECNKAEIPPEESKKDEKDSEFFLDKLSMETFKSQQASSRLEFPTFSSAPYIEKILFAYFSDLDAETFIPVVKQNISATHSSLSIYVTNSQAS